VKGHLTWLDVWVRAVIVVAWRRAAAVWVGCGIVAALVFGPTGMHPADLTSLALHAPAVGAVLGVTWLLVFVPVARVIVHADGAVYLRALPAPTYAPLAIAAGALVFLQLPWALVWIVGDGVRGLAIVVGLTLVIVLLARWRPRRPRASWPAWRHDGTALQSIHMRALRRRAGDALVRGVGLSILAGAAAGLFVRNNHAVGADAAALGAAVIAVVLVPAQVGALLVVLDTHRQVRWLATSLGITRGTRIAALAGAVGTLQLAGSLIATGAAVLVAEPSVDTIAWLGTTSLAVATGSAIGCTRVVLAADGAPTAAARIVVGAISVAAAAVVCLGLLGVAGVAAFNAAAALALLARPVTEAA
jgi:hypothetical protein